MTPYVVRVPRSRILGLVAVAAAAFGLAFVATQAGRSTAVSADGGPAQQVEHSPGGSVPDSLSAVAAIPLLEPQPAPPAPTRARAPNRTTTLGASPAQTAAPQVSTPVASTPRPAPAAQPAPRPTPAPARAPAPGVSFDDSG